MTDAHDITGGLDLLGDWLDAKGYTEEAGLCTKAMDEINRLRADNERIKEEYVPALDTLVLFDQVCADNARLREALKPLLADYIKVLELDGYTKDTAEIIDLVCAARAAMGESDE